MDSFIGISKAQTTNLAVVAPGIAEALLATAIGLVAAIPAVVIYNLFARETAGVPRHWSPTLQLRSCGSLSRDLDASAPRAEVARGGGVAAMAIRLDHGDEAISKRRTRSTSRRSST